jgi:hypothetical protein
MMPVAAEPEPPDDEVDPLLEDDPPEDEELPDDAPPLEVPAVSEHAMTPASPARPRKKS